MTKSSRALWRCARSLLVPSPPRQGYVLGILSLWCQASQSTRPTQPPTSSPQLSARSECKCAPRLRQLLLLRHCCRRRRLLLLLLPLLQRRPLQKRAPLLYRTWRPMAAAAAWSPSGRCRLGHRLPRPSARLVSLRFTGGVTAPIHGSPPRRRSPSGRAASASTASRREASTGCGCAPSGSACSRPPPSGRHV